MLARVAASKTSSTPSILSAEHSLYARAPIDCATRSACARETYRSILGSVLGGRKSALQPTRSMGMTEPQMDRTSSIHYLARDDVSSCDLCTLTGAYLDSDIIQRVGGVNCIGNKDHMRLGIGQRS